MIWLSPRTTNVSATYRVMRYCVILSNESITASAGGNVRVGDVGRPSRCAVLVSIRPLRPPLVSPITGWPRAVVSCSRGGGRRGRVGVGGGAGGGFCAASDVEPINNNTTTAAAIRRARRRLATQAHQMLISYSSSNGISIINIEKASGGVSTAAMTAAIAIAY